MHIWRANLPPCLLPLLPQQEHPPGQCNNLMVISVFSVIVYFFQTALNHYTVIYIFLKLLYNIYSKNFNTQKSNLTVHVNIHVHRTDSTTDGPSFITSITQDTVLKVSKKRQASVFNYLVLWVAVRQHFIFENHDNDSKIHKKPDRGQNLQYFLLRTRGRSHTGNV